jgi:chaperonin GroEL
MSSKQLMFKDAALTEMKRGVDRLAEAVKCTMGPSGRHVVIEKSYGGPQVTKDGVTVAKEVSLPEPFQAMGAKMVNEVAKRTADKAGDGTTAATVLAQAIFTEGLRHVAAGANPVHLHRGINAAANAAAEAIDAMAIKCKGKEDLKKVAMVSSNYSEEIAETIAEAVSRVGAEGVVEIEDGKTANTTLDYVEGMQFNKGYLSPYFMTDVKTGECVLEDCYILLSEKKISSLPDILPLLNKIAVAGKPLIIVAEEVENEVLTTLVLNRIRGFRVAAVKAPGFGDRRKAMMGDIAVLTGGTFLSEDLGRQIESVELSELGRAKKVVITKDDTTIIEGAGKKKDIDARAQQIKSQHDKSTSDYDREKLMERHAKLTSGVAMISVGGQSEVVMKANKDMVDDALKSTRAAAKNGYVPGGGVALLRTQDAILAAKKKSKSDDEKQGFDIVLKAVEAPMKQIAQNAGFDGDLVVEKVKEGKVGGHGFNAATGEYTDLIKAGVIDAALVAKTALINAASVAGLMLTTDVLITELKEETKAEVGAVS